jgi:predicted TPR repeat methyltransferase
LGASVTSLNGLRQWSTSDVGGAGFGARLAQITQNQAPALQPAASVSVPARSTSERFGARFFERYYRRAGTRVVSRAMMQRRAELIAAFVRHAEYPVRSILDVGCGLGLLRDALLERLPRARYTGLEISDYLCSRYGWQQGSVVTHRARRPYDLVICYDVLQYLDRGDAAVALENLARLCRGVLHFSALTTEDWDWHCDRRRTDRNVNLRAARWYRRRLAPNFVNAGSGMFVRAGSGIELWELEHA